ncbi:MAG: glycosyltransferase family 39 protein [Candidatus Hydrogenedentes bacterium]|nr:glycosyltransferase family 39 protein [Candidatus Hydrogenedentota bacterium]
MWIGRIGEFLERHREGCNSLFMAVALVCAAAILLGVYFVPQASGPGLTEELFRALEWDLVDEQGHVVSNLLKMKREGGIALGLRGKFEFSGNGTLRITLTKPPQELQFRIPEVSAEGGRHRIAGQDAQHRVFQLRERLSHTRRLLLCLAGALSLCALLIRLPLLFGVVLSRAEALGLSLIAFLGLAAYGRFIFSTQVNGLSWWMRETAFRHVKNGLAYTKGLDIASDSPAPLSFGVLGGHHPPGLGLFLAGIYGFFGAHEQDLIVIWIVPLFFHALGAVSFYVLLRNLAGPAQGLCALAFYLLLPMSIFHGRAASHESVTMGLAMTGLCLAVFYLKRGNPGVLYGAPIVFAIACFMGWPAYFYCAAIGVGALFFHDAPARRRRVLLLSLGAMSSIVCMLVFLQHQVLLGSIQALLHAGSRRMGSGGVDEFGYEPYTWTQWADKVLEIAVKHTFGLPLILCALLGAVLMARRLDRQGWYAGAWVLGVTTFVAMLHMVLFHFGSWVHDYWSFYFIPPFAIALSSIPFEAFKSRGLRIASVVVLGVLTVYTLQKLLPALGAI